jgi:hypothetical protein
MSATASEGSWLARGARRWFRALGEPPIRLVLWDGTLLGDPAARVGVRIRDRAALLRLIADTYMQAVDIYFKGLI